MKRHLVAASAFWLAGTIVGEGLLLLNLFPTVGSEQAEEFDLIFNILLIMGIPVFAFVVAVLIYAVLEFRDRDGTERAVGPNRGTRWIPRIWLIVTSSLAAATMLLGLVGLSSLQADASGYGWGDPDSELVVRVTAQQFAFAAEYPDGTSIPPVPDGEFVLPVNTDVKFEITSVDVIHSFWVPAFRMKIDAIPGRTTFFTVHTTELGSFESDEAYRVQCAELCGLNHTTMRARLRVVTEEEFADWLASQKEGE